MWDAVCGLALRLIYGLRMDADGGEHGDWTREGISIGRPMGWVGLVDGSRLDRGRPVSDDAPDVPPECRLD